MIFIIFFSYSLSEPENVHAKFVTESGDLSEDNPMEMIIIHPLHLKAGDQPYDIALLKLKKPIVFSKSQRPISLPDRRLRLDTAGTVAVVAYLEELKIIVSKNFPFKCEL